ncbi:MAG TPA: DUF4304 domain-containing protein [Candidatus Limnocylindrales bacterium]|nr:DUF4304 domain-containing protein [Candidatus Limnocylindrales bacterium]
MAGPAAASRVFDRWLAVEVRPFLAKRGWHRRASTFLLPTQQNTGLLVFQKSKWNDARTCRFTIEVDLFSPRLARYDAEDLGLDLPDRPTRGYGSMARRLTSLMGEEDLWWTVRSSALSLELESLGSGVRDKIEQFALPYVAARLTDEAIRDEMLARLDECGPNALRLLRRLVEDLGPRGRLPDIETAATAARALVDAERAQALADMAAAWERQDEEDVAAADAGMQRLLGR